MRLVHNQTRPGVINAFVRGCNGAQRLHYYSGRRDTARFSRDEHAGFNARQL